MEIERRGRGGRGGGIFGANTVVWGWWVVWEEGGENNGVGWR